METNIERHRRIVANALEVASKFPDSADRAVILRIAEEHLRTIEREGFEPILPDDYF
jgi:hypothetical protein